MLVFLVANIRDSNGSGQGPVDGSCEDDNEPSGFIKERESVDEVSDC
jgi:hypothetical protein